MRESKTCNQKNADSMQMINDQQNTEGMQMINDQQNTEGMQMINDQKHTEGAQMTNDQKPAESTDNLQQSVSATWAEDIIADLDDFIESQGIYIRQ